MGKPTSDDSNIASDLVEEVGSFGSAATEAIGSLFSGGNSSASSDDDDDDDDD